MVVVVHFDVDACFQSAACSMFIPRWLIPAWSVHRLMKWFLNSAQTVWDLYTRTAAPCCCLTLCSIKGERVQFCLFLSFQFRKHRSVGQSVDNELWEEKKEKKTSDNSLLLHISSSVAPSITTPLSLFHSTCFALPLSIWPIKQKLKMKKTQLRLILNCTFPRNANEAIEEEEDVFFFFLFFQKTWSHSISAIWYNLFFFLLAIM